MRKSRRPRERRRGTANVSRYEALFRPAPPPHKSRVLLRPFQMGGAADKTEYPAEQKGDRHGQASEMGPQISQLAKKGEGRLREKQLAGQRRRGGNKARQHPHPGAVRLIPFQ